MKEVTISISLVLRVGDSVSEAKLERALDKAKAAAVSAVEVIIEKEDATLVGVDAKRTK